MPVLRIPAPLRVGLIVVSALACAVLAFFVIGGRGRSKDDGLSVAELSAEFSPRAIAADELFLPEEPDFLPALIRSRERRTAWTSEDAAPFWTDPASLDRKPLSAAAAAVVDELLEAVR
jgi:hypothetical protein